jgi:hypothetical protein
MRLSSSSYPVPRLELGENGQRQRHFLPHMFVELTLMISLNLGILDIESDVPVTRAVSLQAHLQTFPF